MVKINATNEIRLNDVFVNIWGYDQTNANFYQVVGRTDKMIIVREIAKTVPEEKGFMTGDVMPIRNRFIGSPVRRRPYRYGAGSSLSGTIYLPSEYGSAQLWDGKPVNVSWYA